MCTPHSLHSLLYLPPISIDEVTHNFVFCPFGFRGARKRKTMKLSRDLSNLVVFTNSVASQECLNEGETPNSVTHLSLYLDDIFS